MESIRVRSAIRCAGATLVLTVILTGAGKLPEVKRYDIPEYSGKKTYMSYTTFKADSKQQELQDMAETDPNGIRAVSGRYCIAIGSRFDAPIGQYVDLLLHNGLVIPCVVGDLKSDKDTDSTNTFSPNGCCSEFIVNMTDINNKCKSMGDMSYLIEAWQSPVKQIIVYPEYNFF